MTGSPWHTDVVLKTDERRHKSNCAFYLDNQCKFYLEKCRGSAHCDAYKYCKRDGYETTSYKNTSKKKRKGIHKSPLNREFPEISEILTIGDEVKERYYVNGKMRMRHGIVVDIEENKVTIRFKNNKGKTYRNTYLYPEMMKDIFVK